MAARVQLATGLGGAIGSDYRPSRNQLDFVEFNGKVSRLNLVRSLNAVVFSGTTTILANQRLDLNDGTSIHGGDIWWEQPSPGVRNMRPQGWGTICNLGMVNFNTLTYAALQNLTYTQTPLNGNPGPSNQLVNGDVFAVHMHNDNYAKVQVLNYGTDIQVRWVTYRLNPRYQILGTGYTEPEDIKVCSDEVHAYVTERSGNLLRVDLGNANRGFATVVSAGMNAPHQIVLDEDHNQAYVVEFANPGRLLRIDLTSGTQTVLISNLEWPIGLLLTQDLRFAYISEQTNNSNNGRISRFQLGTAVREVLVSGVAAPFFMTWTDPGESGILIPQRDPVNQITRIDLTQVPVTTSVAVLGVPFRPSSVAVMAATELLICSNQEITQIDLTDSVYQPAGPMLLGIGHVPVDRISRHSPIDPNIDGYADTTVDPGYFFQVKDTPFGGTLPIMFNHERAYSNGARYYKLSVDGIEPRQSWTDYRWNTSTNRFEAQPVNPSPGGYYQIRPSSELWYNHWLGYMLNTSGLSNGVHTIGVRLFASQTLVSEIGNLSDPGRTIVVKIDNSWPQVSIDQIWHDGALVGTCGIVDSGSDAFTFSITAQDAEQNLLSWGLSAWWGDNKSATVDADSYSNHVSPTKKWAGIAGMVPVIAPSPWHATVAGDPTSRRCAHTFYLGVWDRTINGYNYIHFADYHKSITLLLP